MPAFSPYVCKTLLDFVTCAATAEAPTERWLALMDTNGTELDDAGYTRKSAIFNEAASPQGSASIASNMTFEPFSSAATVFGNALFDASSAGNMLFSGSMMTVRTVNANYWMVVNVLEITLA
jgi:hypothetical protein